MAHFPLECCRTINPSEGRGDSQSLLCGFGPTRGDGSALAQAELRSACLSLSRSFTMACQALFHVCYVRAASPRSAATARGSICHFAVTFGSREGHQVGGSLHPCRLSDDEGGPDAWMSVLIRGGGIQKALGGFPHFVRHPNHETKIIT